MQWRAGSARRGESKEGKKSNEASVGNGKEGVRRRLGKKDIDV